MRKSPTLRFLALFGAMALVFGGCGSLTLGAFDKAQTNSTKPLIDLGNLAHFVTHFLGELFAVLFTARDHVTGTPYHNYLVSGAITTVAFCFLAMPLALFIGFALALMSRSHRRWISVPARTYVEFFRNTPLIVQLLAIYWSFLFLPPTILSATTAGLATLVLNYAAYECENLRAGIMAVDKGQGEASEALGLSKGQTLRLVVVPQMIPTVLPPVINDLIYMYKDSAILSIISIKELTVQSTVMSRRAPFLEWQFYLAIALLYLLLSLPFGRLARWVERRVRAASFAPRRDLTVLAVRALLGVMALGWLCDVLRYGFSVKNIFQTFGQIVAGTLLSLSLILFVFVTLGLIVYALTTATSLARRAWRRSSRQPEPTALPALVK